MTAGYLWKELGTTCRNLPQVHTIMRMIRLIAEIVCPGVILKGDEGQVSLGLRRDLMMHAAMMCMAGFPMLSSGDEIGQLNGCGYHDAPDLCEDSCNLHRARFKRCTWMAWMVFLPT